MSDDTNNLQDDTTSSQKPQKKSIAAQLVELALDRYDLGVDTNDKPFGVRKGGHVVRFMTGGKVSLRTELRGLFYRETGKTASENALTEAVATLGMEAINTEPVELALRVARPDDDELYIDLGDRAERVVRVTPEGWAVIDSHVPVLFRQTKVTKALPVPAADGNLDRLWEFVNMPGTGDRQVITGWLVAAIQLVGLPCPIVALLGEQGTAKTSALKRVLSLFDPTNAPLRPPPKDADNLLHAQHSSRGTGFDNLSRIPPWMSDGLCRGVTGESDVDRSLYTDDDVRVIQVQGVLAFTGIDVGALAADLAERTVWGDLEPIPASQRRSERELNTAWHHAYPSMVGGLLDHVVLALQQLPEVDLAEKPRMADFAEVLAALDLATGSHSLEHYTRAQDAVAAEIVESNEFLGAVARKITERWEGTGKELYELLPRPEDDKYWPKQRGMSGHLRRHAPDLRKSGWEVREIRPDAASKRSKTWVLAPPATESKPSITDADIAGVQLLEEMYNRDHDEWVDRVVADGAAPECAVNHVSIIREGFGCHCQNLSCAASQVNPHYKPLVERSKAIDRQYFGELKRLGLDQLEFAGLVAGRATASEPDPGNADQGARDVGGSQ